MGEYPDAWDYKAVSRTCEFVGWSRQSTAGLGTLIGRRAKCVSFDCRALFVTNL